jgi:hypothetical protein
VEGALAAYLLDLALEAGDTLADQAAVGLELGLTGAAGADAGAEAFEVGPLATEAGEDVLELGQFDLEAALAGAGVLGEDVEDEGGAVEDFDVERLFEVALLGRGELVVEDDRRVVELRRLGDDLAQFALADVGCGVEGCKALAGLADNVSAGGVGEEGEFFEGGPGLPTAVGGWVLEVGSDEESALGLGGGGMDGALGYGLGLRG